MAAVQQHPNKRSASKSVARLAASLLGGMCASPVGELAARLATGWQPETEMYFGLELLASVCLFGPLAWLAYGEKRSWAVALAGFAVYAPVLYVLKVLYFRDPEPGALFFVAVYVGGAVLAATVLTRALALLMAERPR